MVVRRRNKDVVPAAQTISSGSTTLDLVLGGGYPIGKIVNIIGDRSTGKTLLSTECIARARAVIGDSLKFVYDDAEAGYSFDTRALYGFDMTAPEGGPSYTIEDFGHKFSQALASLEKDDTLIYVLDSLDSLTSQAEVTRQKEREATLAAGKELKGGTYGLEKQKQLGEFFRLQRQAIKDKNVLLIIISQVRENIGVSFGNKFTRTGGKALDFYASQIIWLAEIEKIKTKNTATGITIKVHTSKNKIAMPFRQTYIDILFDYGVDDIGGCLDYLFELRTETGKGREGKFQWEKDGPSFTRSKAIKHIEDGMHEAALIQRAKLKWVEFEKSISHEDRKRKYT